MKLCYYKVPRGSNNFGDELNPWIWNQLIPDLIDDDNSLAFVGIGTLLNDQLHSRTRWAHHRVIFGTGAGYGKEVLKLDDSYKVYCVRGPLSAQVLGLEDNLAVTDGAALIRQLVTSSYEKEYQFSYMPHYELAVPGWKTVCQKLGFGYIDARSNVEDVLSLISRTDVLITEAMHGAIVADALRVPWIPVVTNSMILSFKWQDWCASIGVDYNPCYISRLYDPKQRLDLLTPIRKIRDKYRQEQAAIALRKVATSQSPCLSQDSRIESLTEQLQERLNIFRADFQNGLFRS
ncbi:polysaccharide pyruvyl transferase family protein [Limnospira platensis]|uniref:polysaccharide pyruvyl transferase family protein n=1 Tax=Limnospira platensis TaxID=118562 RepID=UPI00028046BD|nr:ExoV-like protein [Arthrospira platensis C1]UWU45812.1 succinoglycan biosynthesis protein ExoV [Arthrospira platensis C1]